MSRCKYYFDGSCALLSKDLDADTVGDRLIHSLGCQEEIIKLQGSVIDDLFRIVAANANLEDEEMKGIINKINEAAERRREYV